MGRKPQPLQETASGYRMVLYHLPRVKKKYPLVFLGLTRNEPSGWSHLSAELPK